MTCFLVQVLVFGHLLVLNSFLTHARCIPECDDSLERERYRAHMEYSDTHVIANVTVSLRDAEGSNDILGDFNKARVCPWHYEVDFNSSRFPQVMYRAQCDNSTWCDNTNGRTYRCLPLVQYQVPILLGTECNLFENTEWSLNFVDIPIACYPSNTPSYANLLSGPTCVRV